MRTIFAQKDCNAQQLPLSTALRLQRAADRARGKRRQMLRFKKRAEKLVLQKLALQIDRDRAAWLAAGSPEHGEVA